jgi:hypothetical protein
MFKHFNKIKYTAEEGQTADVTNILNAFILRRIQIENAFVFQKYRVNDKETAESISEKIYGTNEYYWIIYLVNDVICPFTGWIMSFTEIDKYCEKKYQSTGGSNGINHFYNINDERRCDDYDTLNYFAAYETDASSLPAHIIPVTNYEYENDLNEKKRDIVVIHPRAVRKFVEDFRKLFVS